MKRRRDYETQLENLATFLTRMTPSDEVYNSYLHVVKQHKLDNPKESPRKEVNRTDFWNHTVRTRNLELGYFCETPPIPKAKSSNRILVTGPRVEVGEVDAIITGFPIYRRETDRLASCQQINMICYNSTPVGQAVGPHDIISVASNLPTLNGGVIPVYNFAHSVDSLWQNFFGRPDFLDNPKGISIPLAIVVTGLMKPREYPGQLTVDLRKKLKETAINWNIPIQIINPWAP